MAGAGGVEGAICAGPEAAGLASWGGEGAEAPGSRRKPPWPREAPPAPVMVPGQTG